MKRIIIDTDPGVDDAQAIMMAFAHPEVQVEALTVVAGNVSLERTVANACTILDVLDQNVPVYAGCDSPLVMASEDASYVHGADGLGDAGFAPSQRQVATEHASVALVRLANESPGELMLVTIGPLTNIAVALKLDPRLPEKFQRLVVMGGAVRATGNTANPSTEFNIYADPEAAHVVFEAWPIFDLITWEATLAHGFPLETFQNWRQLGSPRANFLDQISQKTVTYITEVWQRSTLYGADPLAMAVALEPAIVQKSEERPVTVELNGRYTRGQTTVDWQGRSGRPANARIILEVDLERFLRMMEQAVAD